MTTHDVASEPLLSLRGVSKSFDGTPVLKNLDLDVHAGQTLILLGENGAGKSTLKNILCGLVSSDSGEIVFGGETQSRWSGARASELGLGAIHQELSLFPNMSVAENVNIHHLGTRGPFVSMTALERRTDALFRDLLGIDLDSSRLVGELPLGQRQLVEIVKAIQVSSSVLVLDEPTTSLSLDERQQLFAVMRRLREKGYALIHVTHFLEEVEAVGDRVAIMRDGAIVALAEKGELSTHQIEEAMVGRELAEVTRDASRVTADSPVVLEVRDLREDQLLDGVSFSVRAGEIVGIAGLTGAGRSELMQSIVGVRAAEGEVILEDGPFERRSIPTAKKRGLVLVSEDRRDEQAFLERPVRENITSQLMDRFTTGWGWIQSRVENEIASRLVKDFDVKTAGTEADLGSLSGGNQQKAILARWLSVGPKVCLLDEPTKGIDVGAKAQVQHTVFGLAEQGVGVVVVSSDLPELFTMSDRILVMKQGRISAELARADFDATAILRAASSSVETEGTR
ncbi:sugar ABC transporter ATP-binding protein [Schumannella sp. 10F1B-5-1]|uniref:sugar ABC transporter ATP-binding protein n=1 Tax=Schumannella sp. 10F1B-5-1 TaxID=2590780 RepID=UPI00113008AB|nr:sugar ABC transporter ATP-binding protein [Schumannella sp. 10F1B-5-1]TPW72942.1 sugar ABC transporter ATP-binding protein [Schumannella sp. 10F1B-5-1]